MEIRKRWLALGAITFLLVGFGFGLIGSEAWRGTFGDEGHALFATANPQVQEAVLKVAKRYAGLSTFMTIDAPPTHQVVLSDMSTVIATFDPQWLKDNPNAPLNVRSFVVQDSQLRSLAAAELAQDLVALGFIDTKVIEPLQGFPHGTFLLVQSSAFLGHGGIAFRPRGITMASLAPKPTN